MANIYCDKLQSEEVQQVEAETDWRNKISSNTTAVRSLYMPCTY